MARRARRPRGDGRARQAARRPAARADGDAGPQRASGGPTSALLVPRPARGLPRQPDRLAALRRPRHPDPVAGHLRQGQRAVQGRPHDPEYARSARRGAGAGRPARRRHRIRVPVPVRRRPAAVGRRASPRPPALHGAVRAARSAWRTRATSRPPARRWESSAPRRPRASRRPRPTERTTCSTRSHRACTSSTASYRRSTGCTTSRCYANDDEGRALFAAGEPSCAPSCPPTTRADGRATRAPGRLDALLPRAARRLPAQALHPDERTPRRTGRPYCAAADRFTADVTTPPVVEFAESARARAASGSARSASRSTRPAAVTFVLKRGKAIRRIAGRYSSGGALGGVAAAAGRHVHGADRRDRPRRQQGAGRRHGGRALSRMGGACRRGRSSTRARAASARPRWQPRRPGAAPRPGSGPSCCPPTRRTACPTPSRRRWRAGRRRSAGGSGARRSRRRPRWSATGARCGRGWARCSSDAASTASRPRS